MEAAKLGSRINPFLLFTGSFLPNWLLARRELSPGAKLAYARLGQYAGRAGVAYPKQTTLAAELGVSESQLRRYLVALTRCGLIAVERPHRHRAARYTFHAHPWMGGLELKPRRAGGKGGGSSPPPRAPDRSDMTGRDRSDMTGRAPEGSKGRARVDSKRIMLRESPASRAASYSAGLRPGKPRSQDDRKPEHRAPLTAAARETLTRLAPPEPPASSIPEGTRAELVRMGFLDVGTILRNAASGADARKA